MYRFVYFTLLSLLLSTAAFGASGTFCTSGVITSVIVDPPSPMDCQINAVELVLDNSEKVYFNQNFSPKPVICTAGFATVGKTANICGSLAGFLLNPGTVNEAVFWVPYPQSITLHQ